MELYTSSLGRCGLLFIFLALPAAGFKRNIPEHATSQTLNIREAGDSPPSVWNQTCPQRRISYVYTDLNGSIAWDEALCPGTCVPYCEFVLHVPEKYGLFVEFH